MRADGIIPEVSAASIVAKVTRDEYMTNIAAKLFPMYGFEKHVGYGTSHHIAMLQKYGPIELHRFSYKPVQKLTKSTSV